MDKNFKSINSTFIAIDIARGFAALSVFIYHYNIASVLEKATGWSAFKVLSLPGSEYAVPLFFAVSGFCIHWSQLRQEQKQGKNVIDYKKYVLRRFWRIYPTYLIALLFSCTLQAMNGQKVAVWDFLLHLVLLQGFSVAGFNSLNLVLWTVAIEVLFYFLYPFWYLARNYLGLNRSILLALAISCISWIVCAIWLFPYSLPVRWFVLNLWGAWLVGAWLAEQISSNKAMFQKFHWWFLGVAAISITLVCKELGVFDGRGEIVHASIFTILWIWPLSALILAEKWLQNVSHNWGGIIKFLQLCGLSSYSLYLYHMPLIDLRNLLWLNIQSGIIRAVIWFIGFLAILVISWFLYELFEKPFMQYRP